MYNRDKSSVTGHKDERGIHRINGYWEEFSVFCDGWMAKGRDRWSDLMPFL